MGKAEVSTENIPTLAEKCKNTLEKSYGFEIPLPKCATKTQKAFCR
jgi:hypothetical protein